MRKVEAPVSNRLALQHLVGVHLWALMRLPGAAGDQVLLVQVRQQEGHLSGGSCYNEELGYGQSSSSSGFWSEL